MLNTLHPQKPFRGSESLHRHGAVPHLLFRQHFPNRETKTDAIRVERPKYETGQAGGKAGATRASASLPRHRIPPDKAENDITRRKGPVLAGFGMTYLFEVVSLKAQSFPNLHAHQWGDWQISTFF
jgi:hypothetical protein